MIRSHAHLRALDALKPTLSYPGWRQDVAKAEQYHAQYPSLVNDHLAAMRKKQAMHGGDRSHAHLRALDALKPTLSYPGWQQDVAKAEQYHAQYPSLVNDHLAAMRKKQAATVQPSPAVARHASSGSGQASLPRTPHQTTSTLGKRPAEDEVQVVGSRTREERDRQLRANAIDVDEQPPVGKRAKRESAASSSSATSSTVTPTAAMPSARTPATVATSAGPSAIEGLEKLLENLPAEMIQAAQHWCEQTDTSSVHLIVELALTDEFVAALGVKKGGNNERAVQQRLAALRLPA